MTLVRPNIDRIAGYVPGEQPQESGWVKLNTNENPYPPSPCVVSAIEAAARGRLNVYPDPLARQFCRAAAELFDLDPEWILPANGSDENLTILMRTFVDPGELVSYPYPSYILYETLADLQGAEHERLVLNEDWSWDLDSCRSIVQQSKLVLVPNPNSPSGNRWADGDILSLVPPEGVLVLDEAYGDFADEPHRAQILSQQAAERIVITRTLSKSYSLAGIRCGFAIAHPDLITSMRKVKDSYNCNTLSLAAGLAALEDQDWIHDNAARISATRARLTEGLSALGYDVVPSQANFVWVTHPDRGHRETYEALKARKILIRYMCFPEATPRGGEAIDGLRITVGTDEEIDTFLAALQDGC
jgi:histidinol-phosphate aminotransferase